MVAQQLQVVAQATADANGKATFQWASVPQGLGWLGNIRVANAPYTATFVATIGTDDWGTWQGPLYGGAIRAESNVTLKVAGTKLIPGVTYVATWLGVSDNADVIPPAMATASPATPQAYPTAAVIDTQLTTASYTSATLDCSNVKGARYSVFNKASAAVLLKLHWYASSDPTFLLASRHVIVPATLGNDGKAQFTQPNLGDLLVVTAAAVDGSAMSAQLVVAFHDLEITAWSFSDAGVPGELIGLSDTSIAANTTVTYLATAVYGGPAMLAVARTGNVWSVKLQAQDALGAWNTLVSLDNNTTGGLTQQVTLPASPLELVITNGDGSSHPFSACLIADLYRG